MVGDAAAPQPSVCHSLHEAEFICISEHTVYIGWPTPIDTHTHTNMCALAHRHTYPLTIELADPLLV